MTYSSDAIVLKILKTGESDRLLTLLTRDKGIQKAFAKAADRPKNKLHMSTNLFCYGRFTFYEGTSAARISECELYETFFGLQSDIIKLSLAQYFSELIIETAPAETDTEEYLRLLLNSLYFLASDKIEPKILKSIFELRLTSIMGYMPSLIGCSECGTFETDPMYFDEVSGQLYCKNCRVVASSPYSLEVISAMRQIVYSDLQKMFALNVKAENIDRLNFVTEKYLLNNVQKKFKALDFYNSMIIV